MIEADARAFAWEQTNRVNQLKNYLDDRLRTAINDYRKATEVDFYRIKANIMKVEDQLKETRRLSVMIEKLRTYFAGPNKSYNFSEEGPTQPIKGVVEAVQKAGDLIKNFDELMARF